MVYFGHGTEHFAHVIQIEGMAAAGYNDAQITYVGMGADMIEDASVKTGGAEAKGPHGNRPDHQHRHPQRGQRSRCLRRLRSPVVRLGDRGTRTAWVVSSGTTSCRTVSTPSPRRRRTSRTSGCTTRRRSPPAGAGTPTAHLVRQADFSIGGPIMRDKAWFFASYRYADLAARISRSALDVGFLTQLSGLQARQRPRNDAHLQRVPEHHEEPSAVCQAHGATESEP